MRRSISNTETVIIETGSTCHCLSCDLCDAQEDCAPLPFAQAPGTTIERRRPAAANDKEARRLAIIEAQERLMLGI